MYFCLCINSVGVKPKFSLKALGRISINLLESLLPWRNFDFYLCGPSDFLHSLVLDLYDRGISSQQIHWEAFSNDVSLSLPADQGVSDADSTHSSLSEDDKALHLTSNMSLALETANPLKPCQVTFKRSDITVKWKILDKHY